MRYEDVKKLPAWKQLTIAEKRFIKGTYEFRPKMKDRKRVADILERATKKAAVKIK